MSYVITGDRSGEALTLNNIGRVYSTLALHNGGMN